MRRKDEDMSQSETVDEDERNNLRSTTFFQFMGGM